MATTTTTDKPTTVAPARNNTTPSDEWSSSFFGCCTPFDKCLLAFCVPCMLYGQTQDRLSKPEEDPSLVNGMCCAWCLLSFVGCGCILQCVNRTKMREKYGIDGSSVGDFCLSCCCPCPALVQESKEAIKRNESASGYQAPQGMSYAEK